MSVDLVLTVSCRRGQLLTVQTSPCVPEQALLKAMALSTNNRRSSSRAILQEILIKVSLSWNKSDVKDESILHILQLSD